MARQANGIGAQSTVLAGGRYGGLVEAFGGPAGTTGVGWAAGIDRLALLMQSGDRVAQARAAELVQKPVRVIRF